MLPDSQSAPTLVGVRYQDNNTLGRCPLPDHSCVRCQPIGQWIGGGPVVVEVVVIRWVCHDHGGGIFCRYRPGEGNGTAFQAQDGAFDSEVESILPKDLNVTGFASAPTLVGVRYKDNNNTWGDVLYQTIHVYDANPSGGGSGGPAGGGSGGSSAGFATI